MPNAQAVLIGDMNGDGSPDVFAPDYSSGSVSILLQSIPPILQVSPASLSFTANLNQGNSSPIVLTISNSGEGTANWTATSSQSWLVLGQTSGTAPSGLNVSVNLTGLTAGTYNATLTISAAGASNSPQVIPVMLTVSSQQVVVGSLTFSPIILIGPGNALGTVTLSGPAPEGGASVSLSSNNPYVQVPANMTVLTGASSGTFSVSVSAVSSRAIATITATYNQVFTSSTLTVLVSRPSFGQDFDGDLMTDILWRNQQTGQNAIWLMNGFNIKNVRIHYADR